MQGARIPEFYVFLENILDIHAKKVLTDELSEIALNICNPTLELHIFSIPKTTTSFMHFPYIPLSQHQPFCKSTMWESFPGCEYYH